MNRRNGSRSGISTWLVGAAGFAGLFALAFGGCSLERSGTIPQDCTAAAQCDDANACTVDVCDEKGLCGHLPNDDLSLPQVLHDCQHAECQDGAPTNVPDKNDFNDDHESCTSDSCEGTTVTHAAFADGTVCSVADNSGTCNAGTCEVKCTAADAAMTCDDQNACSDDSCNLGSGTCQHDPVDGSALPDADQTLGNCTIKVCQLGQAAEVADNTDLPDDKNPCTNDVCTEGLPSNPNQALDFGCSGSDPALQVCDGNGACVACNSPNQCDELPGDDDCQQRTCTVGVCGQVFTATDTPVSAGLQANGDCKKKVCNGTGGTKSNNDDVDLPIDSNECTKNVCTNGVPTNPAEALNTSCGAMGKLYCDGNKACVGCTADGQCAADTFCQDNFCDAATKVCKANNTITGTPLPTQTAADCQEIQCNGLGGTKSVAKNTDVPPDDGKQCTTDSCSLGVPVHPKKDLGTVCNQDMGKVCDANGACVECNSAATDCVAAADCKSATCSMGTCGVANDALGSACDAQSTGDCKTATCNGAGACNQSANNNADLGSDSNACTSDSCNAGSNVYTPLAVNTQVANACDDVMGCGVGSAPCACDGAATCKSKTGATCAVGTTCISAFCADGFCCNNACNAACAACSKVKGAAANGTCGAASSGTSCRANVGLCDVAEACDGTATTCPNDAVAAAGFECRANVGLCDVAETCDGTDKACPADGFAAANVECRTKNGDCDVAESCTGMATACPADGFAAATVECRTKNGDCDVAESCTGMATACPADGFAAATVECRTKMDLCDVAEKCTGMATTCPADAIAAANVKCRTKMDACDVAETCDGTVKTCPADAVLAFNMLGDCDLATQSCNGVVKTCKLIAGQACLTNDDCLSDVCMLDNKCQ